MIVEGEWRGRRAGGPLRPVVTAYLIGTAGVVIERSFLVDSGADRTAFCRETLDQLAASVVPGSESAVAGVGGVAGTVLVQATLAFRKETGDLATVAGPFLAFLEASADDEDILGRDVTNNFVSITDYPDRRVLLLHGSHSYAITGPMSPEMSGSPGGPGG